MMIGIYLNNGAVENCYHHRLLAVVRNVISLQVTL